MNQPFQVCSRCVLDTTVQDIWFDEKGICKYCKIHDELEKKHPPGEKGRALLDQIVEKIKDAGKDKEYDCLVGVSGGRDSTFLLYTAVQLGLRPLAVHFDNGWDSEIAVTNIRNATNRLGVDLRTIVADWEEFKDLQIAFLKASVPDAEVPTDYVIYSVLMSVAVEENIKYILEGHSFRTEGTSPISWTYMDGRYIRRVHRLFGKKKITSFPVMSLSQLLRFIFVKKIKYVRPLEFIDYNQKRAGETLEKELAWEYYGGHHHESVYTRFFQTYLLPRKFGIDKRKTEFSALIRSGQVSREEALAELRSSGLDEDGELRAYVIKKLGLTEPEFEQIYNEEVKSFRDYPSYFPLMRSLRWPIRLACRLKLLPHILYLKYAS